MLTLDYQSTTKYKLGQQLNKIQVQLVLLALLLPIQQLLKSVEILKMELPKK